MDWVGENERPGICSGTFIITNVWPCTRCFAPPASCKHVLRVAPHPLARFRLGSRCTIRPQVSTPHYCVFNASASRQRPHILQCPYVSFVQPRIPFLPTRVSPDNSLILLLVLHLLSLRWKHVECGSQETPPSRNRSPRWHPGHKSLRSDWSMINASITWFRRLTEGRGQIRKWRRKMTVLMSTMAWTSSPQVSTEAQRHACFPTA